MNKLNDTEEFFVEGKDYEMTAIEHDSFKNIFELTYIYTNQFISMFNDKSLLPNTAYFFITELCHLSTVIYEV